MTLLLDRCATGVRTDAWLVFEDEPASALHDFWADDPLDTAMRQAVLEEQAAVRLFSEPLRRACAFVYASRGALMADVAHPWPQDVSAGCLTAVVISPLEATPIVITQDARVDRGSSAVDVPAWQRPGLTHLPADLPGLVLFRAVQERHPVQLMTRSVFGEGAVEAPDDGTWNK